MFEGAPEVAPRTEAVLAAHHIRVSPALNDTEFRLWRGLLLRLQLPRSHRLRRGFRFLTLWRFRREHEPKAEPAP